VSARRLLPSTLAALVLFGLAALLVGRDVHLALASLAFGATVLAAARTFQGHVDRALWRDYVTLTKPRIMSLLLLTGGAGAFVGASGVPAWGAFAATMVGLALACGGASALNHYLDRDIDKLMGARTAQRPVASGRMLPERALEFGLALSAFSFVLLDSLVNLPTAILALAGNLFYVLVYTRWLKRSTPQNIVIRRRRRCGPAARRIRGRERASRLGGARDVRRRVRVDAAAFLGARADDQGALRARRRADAARRER